MSQRKSQNYRRWQIVNKFANRRAKELERQRARRLNAERLNTRKEATALRKIGQAAVGLAADFIDAKLKAPGIAARLRGSDR